MVSLPILISQVMADYNGSVPEPIKQLIDESRVAISTENTILRISQIERQIQILRGKRSDMKKRGEGILKQNNLLLKQMGGACHSHSRRFSESKTSKLSPSIRSQKNQYIPSMVRKLRCA